MQKKQNI